MIGIIIADDHAFMREGLKQMLAGNTDMTVCDEARNGSELLEKALRNRFDVAVSDLSMPGENMFHVIRRIRRERPALRILIWSLQPERHYALPVLKAGASGYLPKESAPEEVANAIRKVHSGQTYISPDFAINFPDFRLSN